MEDLFNPHELDSNELDVAKQLKNKGFLPGPGLCKCGCTLFTIQKDNSQKTSKITWRCSNYKCRNKFNIRINSFFSFFPKITLLILFEVIKCCICLNLKKKHMNTY